MSSLSTCLTSAVMLAAVFWPLEWAFPAREGQRWLRARLATDFVFFAGQYVLWNLLAVGLLVCIREQLANVDALGVAWDFVAQRPLALRVLEAVVLGDVCVYWFHRASHRFDILWRFHAVHHSSEQLDWLAAHREHPVDGTLTQLAINLPAILLGIDLSAAAFLLLLRGVWAIFVHSNVRLPLGPVGYLFGSPQWHRWHHAKHESPVANFANLSPLCDVLFGTHHRGVVGNETFEMGIPEAWPQSYVAQLVAPLLPRRWWNLLFDLTPTHGICAGSLASHHPKALPAKLALDDSTKGLL